MRASLTVACGAGFAGDRIEPAVQFAAAGVDAVVLECLAERTLIGALLQRAADPGAGYDRRLRRRLTPLLPIAKSNGCRIVSNLGAANPAAAAEAVAQLARELGLDGLRVAAVVGDDIDGNTAVTWQDGEAAPGATQWLGVHAYLGAAPMAQALAEGADVVITGRVADSALFAAPAVAFLELDETGLAGALTAGHLLECAGQLTGGNLADLRAPTLSATEYADLGYPLATIATDGTAEISVLEGKAARLDTISCTLQLLYEVHDPRAYLTPDLTLDFGGIGLHEVGKNRVRITGAQGRGQPEQLRAVGFRRGTAVVADLEIAYAGAGCEQRARVAGDTMRLRLDSLGLTKYSVDYVGVDSVLGAATVPPAAPPPELRMHVSAVCDSAELAQATEDELYTLTLAGPAGGCSIRSEFRPHLQVEYGLVPRDQVNPQLAWFAA